MYKNTSISHIWQEHIIVSLFIWHCFPLALALIQCLWTRSRWGFLQFRFCRIRWNLPHVSCRWALNRDSGTNFTAFIVNEFKLTFGQGKNDKSRPNHHWSYRLHHNSTVPASTPTTTLHCPAAFTDRNVSTWLVFILHLIREIFFI